MNKFKVGDKVKRTSYDHCGMKVGDTAVVTHILDAYSIILKGYNGDFLSENFELVPTPHVHAELIKKWADNPSLKIQYQHPGATWVDVHNPSWYSEYEYRIKPEPAPDEVLYGSTEVDICDRKFIGKLQIERLYGENLKFTFDGESGKLKSVEMI